MNAVVSFTADAKQDIIAIARYTAKQWGVAQAHKYAALLDKGFSKIAAGTDAAKLIFPENSSLYVSRCEHHYIFYLRKSKADMPVIMAVLHERMDVMQRLKQRLPN